MVPRLWGVPPLAEGRAGITTVRNPDSPFWIGNLRNSEFRCIVPATSFMEWGPATGGARGPDGKRRQHWFAVADQPIFAFAGVWKDSEIPSFALLSCEPNAVLREAGRDSMPVILPASKQEQDSWLYGDWKRASRLIAPCPSSMMLVRGDA